MSPHRRSETGSVWRRWTSQPSSPSSSPKRSAMRFTQSGESVPESIATRSARAPRNAGSRERAASSSCWAVAATPVATARLGRRGAGAEVGLDDAGVGSDVLREAHRDRAALVEDLDAVAELHDQPQVVVDDDHGTSERRADPTDVREQLIGFRRSEEHTSELQSRQYL